MPVIGPEPSRRVFLLACAASALHAADPAEEAWDLITRLAAALGRGQDGEFLDECDPSMPHYDDLRVALAGLIAQKNVESAIDPVRNEGDDRARDVEVDWTMRLVDRTRLGDIVDRRATVKCRIEKRGKSWKIVRLEPISFFVPPSA